MTLSAVIISLVLVLDPFGNIPVFMSLLKTLPPKRRRLIILRELIIALGILVAFLFFGQALLSSFHISPGALRIAGGVVLFLIALRMMFPGSPGSMEDAPSLGHAGDGPDKPARREPFIVPLAVPLIAGPSAMAYIILLGTQYPDERGTALLGIMIAWAISAVVLMLADFLAKLLGDRLLTAIERLMGMILTTLAVQMLLEGIAEWQKTIA